MSTAEVTRMPRRTDAQIGLVPTERLLFHPRNVRKELGDLRELADSIAVEGVLCPVMVERRGDTLRLLAGHRRVAAARLAGLRKVPCVIVGEHEDDEAISIMLAENLQRAGLSKDEKRAAVRTLRDEFGHSAEGIAQRLGVTADTVRRWAADPDHLERKPHSRAAVAQQKARVGPSRIYDLANRWDGHAPPDLIAEMRALIGDWQPAERSQS